MVKLKQTIPLSFLNRGIKMCYESIIRLTVTTPKRFFTKFLYIRAKMGSCCPPRHGKDVFDVELFSIFWRRPSLCLLEHISQLQYLRALIYGFWKHDNTQSI